MNDPDAIRVLHAVKLLSAGGVERLRISIFEHLGPPEFAHRLICTEVTDEWARQRVEELGVQIIETGPVRSVLAPKRYLQAWTVARAWKPAIFHGAIIEGYALAVIAGTLAGVRTRILEETSGPGGRSPRANRLVSALGARATVCLGVSRAVADYLQSVGISPDKIRTIYNGAPELRPIDQQERNTLRRELGWSPDDLVVGTVSRLDDEVKRVSDLITALSIVSDARLRLLIVGEGPDRPALERLAASVADKSDIRFVGHHVDLAPLYGSMDIFALASAREAFGLAIVEAMNAGLPVVATTAGGIPEVVAHGETGLLALPRRPDLLAEHLSNLAASSELRATMGDRGRTRAKRFSEARYVQEIESLYRELLEV